MQIKQQVAVVTGAASGIGRAVAERLAAGGAVAVAMVDLSDAVAAEVKQLAAAYPSTRFAAWVGDTTDAAFRARVFDEASERFGGPVRICVPAAGITRDRLGAKIDRETGKCSLYPAKDFQLVMAVNLIAPVYWSLEMVGRLAERRKAEGLKKWSPEEGIQAVTVMIGSVSSRGNRGQVSYSATKAGLVGAAASLTQEGMFHGARCVVVHPGFTDTPMVRSMGEELINEHVLPHTHLGRLIKTEEIADAVCFMIGNPAVSGALWADAGWQPTP
jgi:NAD(P)-dependent dehydrogenase (short-subunit alcohol dehydrogenase family)